MTKIKKIYIEITNNCNLSCSFCKVSKRGGKALNTDEFKHIINSIKNHTTSVYFHVLGEPLLHEEVGNFLDICYENNIEASITTNGTLIGAQTPNLIKKPAVRQINYSLHSLQENKITLDSVLDDIFKFIEITRKDFYHCLRLWNFKTADEKDNQIILDKIRSFLNMDMIFPENITTGHGIKLDKNIYLQQQERFIWPDINGEEIFLKGKCQAIRHDIAILSDGRVVPCCLDADGVMEMGNIFTDSLENILNTQRARDIYNGFSRGEVVERFCKSCGFAGNRFQGKS